MKLVIAGGKGGVGKSMLASSLAILFSKERKIVACDCDVDAPNLGLWLGVTKYDKIVKKVSLSEKALIINEKACIGKLKPSDCKFGALKVKNGKLWVNPFLCEGCGVCKLICEEGIKIEPVENGEIRVARTRYGFILFSAQLYPGEKGSGKIVEELRHYAEEAGEFIILDAAAGIGCPVIASLRGVDHAVMVTEPTLSALSDLKRILKIVTYFKIPYDIVINKYDINERITRRIEEKFKEKVIGKISYSKDVINALVHFKPVIELENNISREVNQIFKRLKEKLNL